MNHELRIMQKYKKTFFLFLILSILHTSYFMLPAFVHAAETAPAVSTLIPCDGVVVECDFAKLMELFAKVIDYVVTYLVIPGATISFAFVGWKLMTSGSNSEARTEAKKSAIKVAIGLMVILAAWLIVRTVLKVFLTDALIDKLPLQL
jgi:heme A synthase